MNQGPDVIECINGCGFWVPGDGARSKLLPGAIAGLVQHHKDGCPGPTLEDPLEARRKRFETFASHIGVQP
jgi:hypothetical protein